MRSRSPGICKLSASKIVIIVCCLSATIVRSSSTGPPAGSSGVPAGGGFPAEVTCVDCHGSFPLNPDAEGKVEFLDVPEVYEPGRHYTLTFKITHPHATRWGFQVTAIALSTFRGAGDFIPLNGDQTTQRISGGFGDRIYIEHGRAGKAATGLGRTRSYSWRFEWVAPSTNVGEVEFFGAGNASNGDGSSDGDKIYSPSPQVLARAMSETTLMKEMP
jgi:hypothetical protein